MMIGQLKRFTTLTALAVGLVACSSGPAQQSRTTAPTSQSGTMDHSGMGHGGGAANSGSMGQMDHAQMMQHCRSMMQGGGMANGGGTANSGSIGQMDHAQMMQHCRSMMQSESGTTR